MCVHPKGGEGGKEEPRNGLKGTEPAPSLFPGVSSTPRGLRATGTNLTHVATCLRPERAWAAEKSGGGSERPKHWASGRETQRTGEPPGRGLQGGGKERAEFTT